MKWVIEFDIVGLFDNINHEKLLELVRKHCHEKWILMYIDRCLKAPILMPDKTLKERNAGTPQGGVISPVLANLFMHYAFDSWMTEKYSKCPWERYADDGIIHCVSRKQAEFVLDMLKEQMKRYGLTIHPEKSKIVFCRGNNEPVPKGVETSFVFLGLVLAVCIDHVHICVSIPPKLSISNFMGYLKGKSTLMIYDRHPELQSKWDKAFWARGYYVATVGNVTEDAIKKYIREQSEESRKEDREGAVF